MQATSVRQRDPAHDVLRIERRPLDALFAPQSVAVIGASETPGSVDRALVGNLTQGAPRHQVFVVNPHHASIFGLPAYPTIGAVPAAVDLAVIATPAETVSQALAQCIEAGVRAAIVISAGFKESGPEGAAREQALTTQLRRQTGKRRLRLIGPNCFGVMCPSTGLNATFAPALAQPGSVAFICSCQSVIREARGPYAPGRPSMERRIAVL